MKFKTLIKNVTTYIVAIMLLLSFSIAHSQDDDFKLTKEMKRQVIDTLVKKTNNLYVFEDLAKEMTKVILDNYNKGLYSEIDDPNEFAAKITEDMRSANNDKHFGIRYSPEQIIAMRATDEDAIEEYRNRELIRAKKRNFAFKEIDILPGNIGYLRFDQFYDAHLAGETAIAAMNFLANTDAIIFDLRYNGGGSPSMIQLITSYLYDEDESRHINSFYFRPTDEYQQFWTLPYVPGNKNPEADVYVLTSTRTFSAAEEFTYNLKNMERATIVGETTGGGAHPVDVEILSDEFLVRLPKGRAVNPITKTNWEGVGIEPHFTVPMKDAKDFAYKLALEKRIEQETNEDWKTYYQWIKDELTAKLNPVKIDTDVLKSYAGVYGPRTLTYEDGVLYYQREDREKMKMIPLNETIFMFDDVEYFRLKVVKEDGKITGVEGIYDNGRTDFSPKS
ncbi:S41 family peptidase [Bacteroidota bacterium]